MYKRYSENHLEILFQGRKPFFKNNCSLDIVILYHHSHDCLEILSFHPVLKKETNRIYMNLSRLISFVKPQEIEVLYRKKLEGLATKVGQTFRSLDGTDDVLLETLIKNIFNGLNVVFKQPDEPKIQLHLSFEKPNSPGKVAIPLQFSIPRPIGLIPANFEFSSSELGMLPNKDVHLSKDNLDSLVGAFQTTLRENSRTNSETIRDIWKKAIRKVIKHISISKVKDVASFHYPEKPFLSINRACGFLRENLPLQRYDSNSYLPSIKSSPCNSSRKLPNVSQRIPSLRHYSSDSKLPILNSRSPENSWSSYASFSRSRSNSDLSFSLPRSPSSIRFFSSSRLQSLDSLDNSPLPKSSRSILSSFPSFSSIPISTKIILPTN